MDQQKLIESLAIKTDSKIVMLIMDGVGGIPHPDNGNMSSLEASNHPNLDYLVSNGVCGLSDPVLPGITPGSGPAHVSLFGYDPMEHMIGRGLLDTLGVDFDFTENDLAARGNFATIDENGIITDRRAGRISTDECIKLCEKTKSNKNGRCRYCCNTC